MTPAPLPRRGRPRILRLAPEDQHRELPYLEPVVRSLVLAPIAPDPVLHLREVFPRPVRVIDVRHHRLLQPSIPVRLVPVLPWFVGTTTGSSRYIKVSRYDAQ